MQSDYLETLIESKLQAIHHTSGPLLIIAGPGSGKTELLVLKTAHLLTEEEVPPESILVITFRAKSAYRFRDELAWYIGQCPAQLHVSNFNTLCQQLLDDYYEFHPYGRNYRVLDEKGQYLFINTHLKELNLHAHARGNLGNLLWEVLSVFNRITEDLVDIKRLGEYVDRLCIRSHATYELYKTIVEAHAVYIDLLRNENLLDGGLLQRAVYDMLMNHKIAREKIQKRFKHVIVDEYNDTKAIQDVILRIIAKPEDNICVAGDNDQGEQIVNTSQDLIDHNPASSRYMKVLESSRGMGSEVSLIHEKTYPQEADKVVRTIGNLKKYGLIESYDDVAILFSSVKFHAGEYFHALDRHHIPYTVVSNGLFFEREDIISIQDLIKYCGWKHYWQDQFFDNKVLSFNSKTVDAIKQIIEDPINYDTVTKLKKLGVGNNTDRQKLLELFDVKKNVLKRKHSDLLELFYDLLMLSGYFKQCCEAGKDEVLFNLALFSSIVGDFDQVAQTNSTTQFNRYIWGLPENSENEVKPDLPDTVKIMDFRQSKGQEFPVVIIGSAVEGRLPRRPRSDKFPMPMELRLTKHEDTEDLYMLDQRKLFYVGMTRAQDLLIFATSDKIKKRGMGPSRFIRESKPDMNYNTLRTKKDYDKLKEVINKEEGRQSTARERLSFSAIHTYLSCPILYKFIYEYKFREPMWPWHLYGKSVHRTLEHIHNEAIKYPGKEFTHTEVEKIYNDNWIPCPQSRLDFEKEHKGTGLENIWRYVTQYQKEFDKISLVEQYYIYPMDDFVLAGRIDVVQSFRGEAFCELIDFKTLTYSGFTKENLALQLQIYGMACQVTTNKEIDRIGAHLLNENERIYFDWNNAKVRGTEIVLNEIGSKIAAKDFPANPGEHCLDCSFNHLCPHAYTG